MIKVLEEDEINAVGKFDYQVIVSKEGQDDIKSEYATVTIMEKLY